MATAFSVSHEITMNQIIDATNNLVFSEDMPDELGYFIFVDLEPEANWAHDCVYVFVSANHIERRSGEFPPHESIKMHQLSDISTLA